MLLPFLLPPLVLQKEAFCQECRHDPSVLRTCQYFTDVPHFFLSIQGVPGSFDVME
jgi:hypothetical protein